MIGDMIGKPGRVAVEQLLPELREERGIDFVTANGENVAGGMGLTPSTADAILASGVDVITSGNHIWDKREIYPYLEANDRVLRPLNYGTHEVPGRGWGTYQALDGTDIAVINLQGRTYMQPDREPVHRRRPAARGVVRAAAAGPPRRLPLRADLGEERARAVPRRPGQRRRRDAHPRRHRRRADPAQRHGLPDRPRHDRAGLERHRLRAADGPAALHQRPADALRGGRGDRSSSTPSRSTSIRPPAAPSPSSGSSGSSRRDVTAGAASAPPRPAAADGRRPGRAARPRRRSTSTPTRPAPTGSSRPAALVAAGGRRRRPAARADRPRHAGRLPRGRWPADAVPAGLTLIPGVEINAIVTRDLGLWEGELHILGFGMDPDDAAFEATLAAQRGRRRERFEQTVAPLRELDLLDRRPARRPVGLATTTRSAGRPSPGR